MQLFSADATMLKKYIFLNFLPMKNWKSHPKKLLRIGPDPFFPRSSPGHSPQPKIDIPYQEISGPDICSLICGNSQPSIYFGFDCWMFFFLTIPWVIIFLSVKLLLRKISLWLRWRSFKFLILVQSVLQGTKENNVSKINYIINLGLCASCIYMNIRMRLYRYKNLN